MFFASLDEGYHLSVLVKINFKLKKCCRRFFQKRSELNIFDSNKAGFHFGEFGRATKRRTIWAFAARNPS